MKKWIAILSSLLLVQLVLAIVINMGKQEYGAFQAREKLIAFDAQAADGLRIEDNENKLMLKKQEGKWLLPESGNFPANADSVERLMEKLSALEKGWPVATTGGAIQRFKVADDEFERKITVLSGEEVLALIYVGTSPGFRKVHVRPVDEDAVFSVVFNSWEANAKADDWIDKDLFKLDETEIESVEMPGFVLQQEAGGLKIADLNDKEQIKVEESRSLLDKLTGLRIQSLLGTEAKPEYRQEEPTLEINVVRNEGEALGYRFSKPQDASYYVLKRSDQDHYVQVAEHIVNPIKEMTREKLVQATPEQIGESNEEKPAAVADTADRLESN